MSDSDLPLILETDTLASLPVTDNVLLVAVCSKNVFLSGHIPGAQLIEPAELVSGSKPAVGKLPSAERLSQLFSRIGLTADKHVIAYDDEGGGWAGRLIWTLDVLGHHRASYLNGGLVAWRQSGQPLSGEPSEATPSTYEAVIDASQIATRQDVEAQIAEPKTLVWDARSREEYVGSKLSSQRGGHIPGAFNLDWLELMDRDKALRLKPLAEIRQRLQSLGVGPDTALITHCQTHHRSGLSYLVGRALDLNIRAYDGSWSEWGNLADTPIETGPGAE